MKHVYQDDRTEAQRTTHYLAWIGTDSFMSGWGMTKGGTSVAGWAFGPGESHKCEAMVRARGEMKRVREVDLRTYRPTAMHTHIYVYGANHE